MWLMIPVNRESGMTLFFVQILNQMCSMPNVLSELILKIPSFNIYIPQYIPLLTSDTGMSG